MLPSDYLVSSLLFVLLGSGVLFYTFFIYRRAIVTLARDQKDTGVPGAGGLLLAALFGSLLWAGGTAVLVFILMQLLVAMAEALVFVLLAPLALALPVGWAGCLLHATVLGPLGADYRRFVASNPSPKFQVWLSDILAGVFAVGLAMAINLGTPSHRADIGNDVNRVNIAASLAYVFISQGGAFFIALDACRRSPTLNVGSARMAYIFFIMAFFAIPPVFLFALPAWWAWRYALWKTSANQAG